MKPTPSQSHIIKKYFPNCKDVNIIMEFGNEVDATRFSGSFIADYKEGRKKKRSLFEDGRFVKTF